MSGSATPGAVGEIDDVLTMSSNEIQYGTIRTKPAALSVHRFLPMAVLYFFLNSAGLPVGLFYTTMLSPLLYVWLSLQGKRWVTLKFLVCLLPFIVAHSRLGIASPFYYARSALLLWTTYVTVYAFVWALSKCKTLERLIDELIVLNFGAAMAALILLPTPFAKIIWADPSDNLPGSGHILRLQLLATEPSVYAFLMVPLLIFAVLRLFHDSGMRNCTYAAMVAIPLLLTQSFGALTISTAALGMAMLPILPRVLRRRNSFLLLSLIAVLLTGLFLVPNPISIRLSQVAMGTDSSTRSRTDYSFILAYMVATSKSLWWGVGLGQTKLYDVSNLGLAFSVGVIPNAIAGTFAELGIFGVLVKIVLEIYFFFRTRVYADTFRIAMFVVAFLFQLTASHLMNVQEYLLWFFAFATLFPAVNLQTLSGAEAKGKVPFTRRY